MGGVHIYNCSTLTIYVLPLKTDKSECLILMVELWLLMNPDEDILVRVKESTGSFDDQVLWEWNCSRLRTLCTLRVVLVLDATILIQLV